VCYVAPTPGPYRLEISLVFANTFQVMTSRDHSLARGYVNCRPAVSTQLYVEGPEDFSLFAHRKRLPECTLQILADTKAAGFWVGTRGCRRRARIRHMEPAEMLKCLHRKSVLFLGDSEMRFTYGVLQTFLSLRSRADFLLFLENSQLAHRVHSREPPPTFQVL